MVAVLVAGVAALSRRFRRWVALRVADLIDSGATNPAGMTRLVTVFSRSGDLTGAVLSVTFSRWVVDELVLGSAWRGI